MPDLILSDIHGNREALTAVLADAQGRYDRIVCLGDLVGYGADPNYVVDWVRANVASVIRGNHDKVCVGMDPLFVYNPAAQASAEWTQRTLTPENVTYLQNLPRGPLRVDDFDMVHGSPADEDEYLIHAGDVAQAREFLEAQVTFFGHTHVQGGFQMGHAGIRRIFQGQVLQIQPDWQFLVNPGSVGQPRDMDPRAAYAIYTAANRTVEYRRVKYDIPGAAGKILAAGLPSTLAARLYEGA